LERSTPHRKGKKGNTSDQFKRFAPRRISALAIVFATLAATPLKAQIALKSEEISARFGIQGQLWANWAQDATGTVPGYTQNLYLRRLRVMAGGEIGNDLTFFIQTDSPNLGKTPKSPTGGFMLQDAFLEWKTCNPLRIDGGLYVVPLSRNTLQSTTSYYTMDLSPLTTISNSSTQSAGLRDLGLGARGFFPRTNCNIALVYFRENVTKMDGMRCARADTCNTTSALRRWATRSWVRRWES
jgi:hypothetical protein